VRPCSFSATFLYRCAKMAGDYHDIVYALRIESYTSCGKDTWPEDRDHARAPYEIPVFNQCTTNGSIPPERNWRHKGNAGQGECGSAKSPKWPLIKNGPESLFLSKFYL